MQMELYYTIHTRFVTLSVGQNPQRCSWQISRHALAICIPYAETAIPSGLSSHTDNTGLTKLGDDALAGWFNLLGQVAVTAAIEYSLANHLACMIVLGTGGAGTGGHVVTQGQLLGIYAGAAFVFFSVMHSESATGGIHSFQTDSTCDVGIHMLLYVADVCSLETPV